MKKLLVITALLLSSTVAHADIKTNELLVLCKSRNNAEYAACVSYVAGAYSAYLAMAMTSIKSADASETKIAGICMPSNAKISPPELIAWTEQLVLEWRAEMRGALDPMGDMYAGMTIIASIRKRWPCK